jgi:hypothetical protein
MLDARTFDTALIKLSSIITGNPWTCNIIRPKIRFQEDPSFLAELDAVVVVVLVVDVDGRLRLSEHRTVCAFNYGVYIRNISGRGFYK